MKDNIQIEVKPDEAKESVPLSCQASSRFLSYIDPTLEITEDLYAISYVKKNYDSGSKIPEHAFIIIQTPN